MTTIIKKIAESSKVERRVDELKFDDICFTELGDIFNKNAKWKSIATVLGYQDYVVKWQNSRNPTKVLLNFAEVIEISYQVFITFFT